MKKAILLTLCLTLQHCATFSSASSSSASSSAQTASAATSSSSSSTSAVAQFIVSFFQYQHNPIVWAKKASTEHDPDQEYYTDPSTDPLVEALKRVQAYRVDPSLLQAIRHVQTTFDNHCSSMKEMYPESPHSLPDMEKDCRSIHCLVSIQGNYVWSKHFPIDFSEQRQEQKFHNLEKRELQRFKNLNSLSSFEDKQNS